LSDSALGRIGHHVRVVGVSRPEHWHFCRPTRGLSAKK
jgi:hypothetical protein